jgi:hypothetical protein
MHDERLPPLAVPSSSSSTAGGPLSDPEAVLHMEPVCGQLVVCLQFATIIIRV